MSPPLVQILPMAGHNWEFKDYTIQEVQEKFFLEKIGFDRKPYDVEGDNTINPPKDAVILFQFRSSIVASAMFVRRERLIPPKGEVKWHLIFRPDSIKVFDPVSATEMNEIWPEFTQFRNSRPKLAAERYQRFEQLLEVKNIRMPLRFLTAHEGESETQYVSNGIDERTWVEQQVCERRGRTTFRNGLVERYGARCLVTGSTLLAILEAAHINPYRGEKDDHLDNGVLLRADIHTLFDLHLLGIEPEGLEIEIHPELAAEYGHLAGKCLQCSGSERPSTEALQQHFEKFTARRTGPS